MLSVTRCIMFAEFLSLTPSFEVVLSRCVCACADARFSAQASRPVLRSERPVAPSTTTANFLCVPSFISASC